MRFLRLVQKLWTQLPLLTWVNPSLYTIGIIIWFIISRSFIPFTVIPLLLPIIIIPTIYWYNFSPPRSYLCSLSQMSIASLISTWIGSILAFIFQSLGVIGSYALIQLFDNTNQHKTPPTTIQPETTTITFLQLPIIHSFFLCLLCGFICSIAQNVTFILLSRLNLDPIHPLYDSSRYEHLLSIQDQQRLQQNQQQQQQQQQIQQQQQQLMNTMNNIPLVTSQINPSLLNSAIHENNTLQPPSTRLPHDQPLHSQFSLAIPDEDNIVQDRSTLYSPHSLSIQPQSNQTSTVKPNIIDEDEYKDDHTTTTTTTTTTGNQPTPMRTNPTPTPTPNIDNIQIQQNQDETPPHSPFPFAYHFPEDPYLEQQQQPSTTTTTTTTTTAPPTSIHNMNLSALQQQQPSNFNSNVRLDINNPAVLVQQPSLGLQDSQNTPMLPPIQLNIYQHEHPSYKSRLLTLTIGYNTGLLISTLLVGYIGLYLRTMSISTKTHEMKLEQIEENVWILSIALLATFFPQLLHFYNLMLSLIKTQFYQYGIDSMLAPLIISTISLGIFHTMNFLLIFKIISSSAYLSAPIFLITNFLFTMIQLVITFLYEYELPKSFHKTGSLSLLT